MGTPSTVRFREAIASIMSTIDFCVTAPLNAFHERQPIGGSRPSPLSTAETASSCACMQRAIATILVAGIAH